MCNIGHNYTSRKGYWNSRPWTIHVDINKTKLW
jgi:hypothetical protein